MYFFNKAKTELVHVDVESGEISIMQPTMAASDTTPAPVQENTPEPTVRKYTKKLKVAKPGKFAKEKKQKGGRTSVEPYLIQKILALKQDGMKPRKIAEETGVDITNVYYYTAPGYGKKIKQMEETPTKVGERAIDQDRTIKAKDWDEMKEALEDGSMVGIIKMSYTDYEEDEIRRALKFDTHQEYIDSKK